MEEVSDISFMRLGIDSLDSVEMIMDAEKYFEVEIKDEEFDRLVTIKELQDLIDSKITQQ